MAGLSSAVGEATGQTLSPEQTAFVTATYRASTEPIVPGPPLLVDGDFIYPVRRRHGSRSIWSLPQRPAARSLGVQVVARRVIELLAERENELDGNVERGTCLE